MRILYLLLLGFFSFSVNAQISGTLSVCVSSTTSLSVGATGGLWSTSDPSVATVGSVSGIVTGINAGTAVIAYTAGTGTDVATVTVNPLPAAIAPAHGSMCWSGTYLFTSATSGGVWSSGSPSIAAIGSLSGVVSGVGAGSANITYTLSTGCKRTAYASVISGPPAIMAMCDNLGIGDTLEVPYMVGGCMTGYWELYTYSTNYSVLQTGIGYVVGASSGTATIRQYSSSTGCWVATKTLTVTPTALIHPIVGPEQVCRGSSITLTNINPGGTWSSSNPATGTVTTGGIVTGVSNGYTVITYTVSGQSCPANVSVLGPTFSGPSSVCNGDSLGLSAGNLHTWGCDVIFYSSWWSSSDTTVLAVKRPSSSYTEYGKFWALSAGTTTITLHDNMSGCTTSRIETVNPTPAAVSLTGPSSVCTGSTITIIPSTFSGIWSTATGNASVSGGVVTGVSPGVDTIRYSISNICGSATLLHVITINATPSVGTISGLPDVCEGAAITLTTTGTGGTWSTANGHAGISGGVATGLSAGVDTIVYSVSSVCATASTTHVVTINPLPVAGALTGPTNVCHGSSVMLSGFLPGGTWSSGSAATVSGGTVTGILAGTATISYSLTNGCGSDVVTKPITVNPLPDAGVLSGAGTVCIGATITLTSTAGGGTWSSTNAHAAVSGSVVTGVSVGIDTIYYSVTNMCGTHTVSKIITVNTVPAGGFTGPSTVCVGATVTLTPVTSGGTWSSSGSAATVSGGTVTGISAGVATISYVAANVCGSNIATAAVTVNPLPDAGVLSGAGLVCIGTPVTLSSTISGGSWSASNTNATMSGGVVTGVTSGLDTINYTVINVCGTHIMSKVVTVDAAPTTGSISGAAVVCEGATVSLAAAGGGVWSSYDGAIATVGFSSGVVTGVFAGSVAISYTITNGCGTATAVHTITVSPLPHAGTLSGTTSVCIGSAITLTSTIGGGVWSASNSRASIAGGVVTGLTPGVDTISYSVTNTCGVATVAHIIDIYPLPTAYMVTGGGGYCIGGSGIHIGLMYGLTGVTYQVYMGGSYVSSSVAGTGASIDFGLFTTAGTYTVIGTDVSTGCVGYMSGSAAISIATPSTPVVTVSAMPGTHVAVGVPVTFTATVSGLGSMPAYQWYVHGTIIPGATNSTYTGMFFSGDTVSCHVIGSDVCTSSGIGYEVITFIGTGIGSQEYDAKLVIQPNPNKGAFTLNLLSYIAEEIEVTVIDALGKRIYNAASATNRDMYITLDVSPGIYVVRIATAQGNWSEKIVVE